MKEDINGENASEVYKFITERHAFEDFSHGNVELKEPNAVPWNFAYFIANGKGKVMKYYSPGTKPLDLAPELETLMAQNLED